LRFRKQRGLIGDRVCALPILAIALLNGCVGAVTHEVCGIVLTANGLVEINGQSADPTDSVKNHPGLCAGTIVRTSSGSNVELACLANALVHLSEKTTFQIESITLRKDGNETDDEVEARSVRCRLTNGVMDFSHRGSEGVAEFVTVTPHGTVIAKFSCAARIAVDAEKTRIICASGALTFVPATGGSAVAVEAGFLTEWPSRAPIVAAAVETPSDQQALADLFESGQHLEISLKSRGVMIPWKSR
jgi:hypothetical protein